MIKVCQCLVSAKKSYVKEARTFAGSQYDKNGNLFDWWSPTAAEGFKQRTQCIVDQYNAYVVPEVNAKVRDLLSFGNHVMTFVSLQVNGRLTQGENIADNGGVKEAFMVR